MLFQGMLLLDYMLLHLTNAVLSASTACAKRCHGAVWQPLSLWWWPFQSPILGTGIFRVGSAKPPGSWRCLDPLQHDLLSAARGRGG
jgi:hypothetical protein